MELEKEQITEDQAKQLWEDVVKERAAGDEPADSLESNITETDDPWHGVPQVVRDRLQAVDAIDHRLKSSEGRVAALQRELEVSKQAAKDANNSPTQQQINAASANSEKWVALKEDFPEWVEAIEERLSGVVGTEKESYNDAELRAQNANLSSELSSLRVELKHPGWEDTVNTAEFVQWMQTQPPEVLALAASSNPTDAIKLLDQYSSITDKAQKVIDDRAKRLQQSVSTQTKAGQVPRKSAGDMSPEEYWDNLAKEKAAKRQQSQQSRF